MKILNLIKIAVLPFLFSCNQGQIPPEQDPNSAMASVTIVDNPDGNCGTKKTAYLLNKSDKTITVTIQKSDELDHNPNPTVTTQTYTLAPKFRQPLSCDGCADVPSGNRECITFLVVAAAYK